MADNPLRRAHQEWIGNVRPEGLLVSLPALELAQAAVDRNPSVIHRAFLDLLPRDRQNEPIPALPGFSQFAERVLGWPMDLYGAPPENLHTFLETYREDLRPTAALLDLDGNVLLVISEVPRGTDFDSPPKHDTRGWNASPYARLERLLRETGHPVGVLAGPEAIRLVYAPKGESSAHATFKVSEMATVQGRILLGALHMLLGAERLYNGRPHERLHGILRKSREFQNDVSTKLSRQVLEALYALLHGFQEADDYVHGELLREMLAPGPNHDPNTVYGGLLTVLMRLVFLLYAEDRGLMSQDSIYAENYSVSKLFEQLREDKQRYPEQMSRRYGAWSRLLALFRLVYGGGSHGRMRVPARHGYLFDPARYPFLAARDIHGEVPHVPDGTILEVLQRLLMLDEERLSYRALDVEQIGSVYETVMGFELHVAEGPSIAIRAKKKQGAPVTINLESLLRVPAAERNKWLKKNTDQEVTGTALAALKSAVTVDDVQAALKTKIHLEATPVAVRAGAMVFQPSPERRRSGSHYTPRALTKPIVEAALEPVLKELGPAPRPEQILALKVCDPAMGSGAFLVEACRQLGEKLVEAWQGHGDKPVIEADEDELLLAQRLIAQRCLYGVDKNRMAVDLAKLALWLATLAKDHSFTFLNHTLKHGDSLVGLTPRRIASVDWADEKPLLFLEKQLRGQIERGARNRTEIMDARDGTSYDLLEQKLATADEQLELARMVGDAACAVFFRNETPKARAAARLRLIEKIQQYVDKGDLEAGTDIEGERVRLKNSEKPVVPFHWHIEFPEVFVLDDGLRPTRGFDVVVGNPPFAGKNTLIEGNADSYLDWLKAEHAESHGNADLVAHFFRRSFTLLRGDGCFGLIATNTIGQGDTRSTGLRWICLNGGTIYRAVKRLKWPGEAAVVVSVVHVCRGETPGPYRLSGRDVERITAYLFHAGGHDDPAKLADNQGKSFEGVKIYGPGFTFDDTDTDGIASPLAEMRRLVNDDPHNQTRVFPYLGGEEVNESPTHSHRRYVIDFDDYPLRRVPLPDRWCSADENLRRTWLLTGEVPDDYPGPVAEDWPALLAIVEEKVKPQRASDKRENYRRLWWQYAERRPGLRRAKKASSLALSFVSQHLGLVRVPGGVLEANTLAVFTLEGWAVFCCLQSSVHEIWSRFFGSTLEDRFRYVLADCFETFPFPIGHETNPALEAAGQAYYDFRADLMVRKNEGLTKTYNRFHDPEEQSGDFRKLRAFHHAMDRTVLDAYGWTDIQPVPQHEAEFEEEPTDEDDFSGAKKPKQKYRLRWPEEIRDDVLARLLILNEQRAAAEALEVKTKKKRSKHVATPLFDSGGSE
jgi:hypothetical protein